MLIAQIMVIKLTSNSISDLIKQWINYIARGKMPGKYQSRSALYCNLRDKTYSFYLFFYMGKYTHTNSVLSSNIRVYKKAGAL